MPTSDGSRPRSDPRVRLGAVAGALAVTGVAVAGLAPMPYAVMQPGPVRDVLGTTSSGAKAEPMIAVSGRRAYPTTGRLDMLTVAVAGGPGSRVTLPQVLSAWLNHSDSVQPVDRLYPPDQSRQQVQQENAAEMDSSQENATAAALGELKIPYRTTLVVAGAAKGTPAAKVFKEKDRITSVGGHRVSSMVVLRSRVHTYRVGTTVPVEVRRAGKSTTVRVKLVKASDGRPALGVLMNPTYTFPFTVKISIQSIGGPSAGMMFALGIVDKLTPGSLTGGRNIAGTGEIDAAGNVGAIGGIRQKLVGAKDAGASWFLAPASNCDEVVGHVPKGLNVARVSTLHEARTAVDRIAKGETAGLPTCS